MSNPSKAKGTAEENRILERHIRPIWPQADRAKAGNQSNDIVGVPFPIEVKHRKTWALRDWVRKVTAVSDDGRWAVFAGDGDRRLSSSIGTVMIVDANFGTELLHAWNDVRTTKVETFRVDL